jgi:hypothetical protein
VDSLDWKGISAGEITKRVTGKVQSGSRKYILGALITRFKALLE